MVLDSVPSLQPKYLNGETFSEYGQPSMYTDYTSKGEAYAKFRDSTQTLYGIPPSLMGHQNFINRIFGPLNMYYDKTLPIFSRMFNNRL